MSNCPWAATYNSSALHGEHRYVGYADMCGPFVLVLEGGAEANAAAMALAQACASGNAAAGSALAQAISSAQASGNAQALAHVSALLDSLPVCMFSSPFVAYRFWLPCIGYDSVFLMCKYLYL